MNSDFTLAFLALPPADLSQSWPCTCFGSFIAAGLSTEQLLTIQQSSAAKIVDKLRDMPIDKFAPMMAKLSISNHSATLRIDIALCCDLHTLFLTETY